MNMKELWTNWPDREIGGLQKWYILVQYAFWLQQIMVINIEERRKDHWQMFSHHIVTTLLIFTSYGYHQTKVANVILCLMDVVDIFFPVRTFAYVEFLRRVGKANISSSSQNVSSILGTTLFATLLSVYSS